MTDTTPMTHTPHIEATVVRSAEGPYIGQISVDGSITTIEGRTEDGVRRDIIRAVAGVAQRLDRQVRLIARDSLGTQEVGVSPDGYTEALSPVTPTPAPASAPAPAAAAASDGLDFDAILGLGEQHNPGQIPVSDDDTVTQPAGRAAAIPDLEYLFQAPGEPPATPAPPAAAPQIPEPPAPPAAQVPPAPAVVTPPPPAPISAPPLPPQEEQELPPQRIDADALPPLTEPGVGPERVPTLDDFMAQRPHVPLAPPNSDGKDSCARHPSVCSAPHRARPSSRAAATSRRCSAASRAPAPSS